MKRYLCSFLILLVVLLTACTASQTPTEPATSLKAVTLDSTVKVVAGQTVYVPVYSHIYRWDRRQTMNLTATLSVRNTDLTYPIVITAIHYYDSNGKLVRQYLAQPGELGALASAAFVIDQEDTSGGTGAAFIVTWIAQKNVSSPVIEAVMINTTGNQGVSFVSPGRVIKSQPDQQ